MLVGIPASGKSTWARNHLTENDAYVSRDEVRFSILDEDEDYFAHETEVFNKFVEQIEDNLNLGKRVFADATHINWASRRKLLERIHDKENIDIDAYVFKTPLKTCIERNNLREGRARVPEKVLYRMQSQMRYPVSDPFSYHKIEFIFPEETKEGK